MPEIISQQRAHLFLARGRQLRWREQYPVESGEGIATDCGLDRRRQDSRTCFASAGMP